MKRISIIWTLIVLFFMDFSTHAQYYVDLGRVDYRYGFQRPYDASPEKSSFSELTFDANLPIPITDKLNIISGFNIERLNAAYVTGGNNETFYGIMLKAGVNLNHGSSWKGTYLFLPKISSDLTNINGDHFQFGGLAMLSKKRNRASWWKFGMYVNGEIQGLLLVPLVGFYYVNPGNVEVNLTLPLSADANVQVAKQIKTGIAFQGIVKSYYISNFPTQYLHKTNNELSLYGQFESGPMVFRLMFGSSIGRSFRTFNTGDDLSFAISALKFGDDRSQLNQDFKDGLYFRTSLIYRFKLPEKI